MARRRSARRSEPELDDSDDDDEFAWKPKKKKKKKKSKTAKKKRSGSTRESARSTGRRSSSGESPRASKRKKTSTGKTARTKSSSSNKLSGSSLSRSGRRKKGRRGDSEDDSSSSSTRRRRSGRAAPAKKKGINPVLPISIVTGTILLCLIVIIWSNSRPEKIVDDQPAQLEQAGEVARQGMEAYRAWNKAKSEGNPKVELSKHKEAHEKLVQAMDMYNKVLDPYRDEDGMLPPQYEGHEAPLQDIAMHLVDLEKGSRMKERGGGS